MSTPATFQALANSSTTIFMGTTLKLNVDQSSSTLEVVKLDGSHVDVWGKTLQYAFASQQTTVTLYFTPINGSDPVTASYVNGGTTVSSTQQSGSAVLTIQRPPSSGVSFEIQLSQGALSFVSAIAAPAASARMASADAASASAPSARMASAPAAPVPAPPAPAASIPMASSIQRPSPAVASSKLAGLSPSGSTSPVKPIFDPSARLQTKLVLTTVEPPPDPDARPKTPTA
jgi:hypothetical protein